MSNALLVVLLWTFFCLPAVARDDIVANSIKSGPTLSAAPAPRQGSINLFNGVAQLTLPPSLRYQSLDDVDLSQAGAAKNGSESKQTGFIGPADLNQTGGNKWGIFIRYDQHGHVGDGEVDGIDFEKLLDEIQMSFVLTNSARIAGNYPAVGTLAWAERPYYDKSKHRLYWAQDIEFVGMLKHTLNFEARLLGRDGVLKLEAVCDMEDLSMVKDAMLQVLTAIEFTGGHRYVDFDARSDQRADYGIADLISGTDKSKPAGYRVILTALSGYKGTIFLILLIGGMFYFSGVAKSAAVSK